ncbi:MAG: amidohydrolase [Armatimonadetes bacterium]|nr:amidohydrolase [Armatimonadota bacterium]
MSHLFTSARWWRDGSSCNLHVSTDGKVTYRGPDEPFADDETDLQGAFILPGFVDCHCHILATGLDLQKLDLTGCASREGVLDRVRERAAVTLEYGWLLAVQYDQTRFEDGRHLTADELETATNGLPAILRHTSGHACIANRTAVDLADTSDEKSGEIVRDEAGIPTGVLLEKAMQAVYRLLPKPTRQEMSDAILAAAQRMSGMGITSAADMGSTHDLEDQIWAYRNAAERGARLRMRLYPNWSQVFKSKIDLAELLPPSPMLRIGGVKLYADGAIGAATAATYEEFTVGGTGQLMYPAEELQRRVSIADEAGYSIAIHSIGDRSTDVVLDALASTRDPSRHRIEHAMILSDAQIARIVALGVCVSMQPEFLLRFDHAYKRQLGDERASRLKRVRSLLDAGVALGFSSDTPIVPGNPWDGIRMATEHPTEAIAYDEAVDLYTRGAAALDDDEDFGRLDLMQFADFQVYAENPREQPSPGPRLVAFEGITAAPSSHGAEA